jgi:uncharacterized protein (UPF0261 family)
MSLLNSQRVSLTRGISLVGANTDFPIIIPRLSTAQRSLLLSAIAISNGVSAGAATLGLFTAAGGGGTTLIANVALASLTAVNALQVLTLAAGATGTALSGSPIFARVGTAGLNSIDLELIFSDAG